MVAVAPWIAGQANLPPESNAGFTLSWNVHFLLVHGPVVVVSVCAAGAACAVCIVDVGNAAALTVAAARTRIKSIAPVTNCGLSNQ